MAPSEKPTILVVEDEKNVGSTLTERLNQEAFHCIWAQSIQEALGHLQVTRFQLALLDIGLPDGSGIDLGRKIREKSPATALIFLTALGSPEQRIEGLELGAEDYIVKPFHFRELILRIQNILKRASLLSKADSTPATVSIGKARISFSKFLAESDGQSVYLTHKECALLKLLYERKGHVVSRDEILNQVWSEDEFPTARTVDNFILRLRKIVETNLDSPQIIRSIRGVGYQLIDQGETHAKPIS